MTNLFIVRHGETAWSRTGQHTSTTDLPLTEKGREQAKALASVLDPDQFDTVYCSPRLRAQETAQLAGFSDYQVTEDLAEWNYGQYEGKTRQDIIATIPDWQIWTHGAPGGETPEQVAARLTRFYNRMIDTGDERILVFAHGHALRVLAMTWLGMPLSFGSQLPLDTATVSLLGHYRGRRALKKWNSRVGRL